MLIIIHHQDQPLKKWKACRLVFYFYFGLLVALPSSSYNLGLSGTWFVDKYILFFYVLECVSNHVCASRSLDNKATLSPNALLSGPMQKDDAETLGLFLKQLPHAKGRVTQNEFRKGFPAGLWIHVQNGWKNRVFFFTFDWARISIWQYTYIHRAGKF